MKDDNCEIAANSAIYDLFDENGQSHSFLSKMQASCEKIEDSMSKMTVDLRSFRDTVSFDGLGVSRGLYEFRAKDL